MKEKIEELIAKEIRPALASHGGDCEVIDVKDNKVYLKLSGGCRGCPGARMTIKYGVERIIRENFPEVQEVIDVTEHA
jgi:Fe-S cluster biogenesis protein NfuA